MTMGFTRLLVLGLAGPLVGIAIGYGVWGLPNAELRRDLGKTKAWLMDEIRRNDAWYHGAELQAAQDALAKAQADLTKARNDLAHTQAILKEAADDWRSEQARRKALERELAALVRESRTR